MAEARDVDGIEVLLACPDCQWSGVVRLYDIGDGPEWCCPSCDMCYPSNPVVGPDGLTNAQRDLKAMAKQFLDQRYGTPDG